MTSRAKLARPMACTSHLGRLYAECTGAHGPMGSSLLWFALLVGSVTDANHAAEDLTATWSADGVTACEVAVPAGACC
jgi:hypothetical protein